MSLGTLTGVVIISQLQFHRSELIQIILSLASWKPGFDFFNVPDGNARLAILTFCRLFEYDYDRRLFPSTG